MRTDFHLCLMYVRIATLIAAAVAASAILATAPGAPAHADPDTDEAFLRTVHSQGIYLSDPVTQAHAVCLVIQENPDETFADVARGVAGYDPSISQMDAALFAGSAIAAYCPQYKYMVQES
jgi:hypothetical protein